MTQRDVADYAIAHSTKKAMEAFKASRAEVNNAVWRMYGATPDDYRKKLKMVERRDRLEKIGYTFIQELEREPGNPKTPVELLCPEGHLVQTTYEIVINNPNKTKYVCAVCSGKQKVSQDEVEIEAEKHGITLLDPYQGYFNKMRMVCSEGHELYRSYAEMVQYKQTNESKNQ